MRDGFLTHLAFMLARRSPMLIFALGAIVFAAIRYRRHPRVSLMTAIAFLIYLIDAFVFSTLIYLMPTMITSIRMSSKGVDWFYFFVFFFADFILVIVLVLLVSAAFSQRNTTPANSST